MVQVQLPDPLIKQLMNKMDRNFILHRNITQTDIWWARMGTIERQDKEEIIHYMDIMQP